MHRGLAVLLPLLMVAASAQAHAPGNPFPITSPAYVSFLLDGFVTPDLAPGESGTMAFRFTNTYPFRMANITLRLEVYLYLEIDVDLRVDAGWPHSRPAFVDPLDASGTEHPLAYQPLIPDLDPTESLNVSAIIVTDTAIPHGTLTKQGSYFIRTSLAFDPDGDATNRSRMFSKGYFSDAEFDVARRACGDPCPPEIYYDGILNLTYLGSVSDPPLNHIDGLLPEAGFSFKERMPVWPFAVVGGVMVASLFFAVVFYAEENPGKYPRLARWWLGTKGRVRQAMPPKPK